MFFIHTDQTLQWKRGPVESSVCKRPSTFWCEPPTSSDPPNLLIRTSPQSNQLTWPTGAWECASMKLQGPPITRRHCVCVCVCGRAMGSHSLQTKTISFKRKVVMSWTHFNVKQSLICAWMNKYAKVELNKRSKNWRWKLKTHPVYQPSRDPVFWVND